MMTAKLRRSGFELFVLVHALAVTALADPSDVRERAEHAAQVKVTTVLGLDWLERDEDRERAVAIAAASLQASQQAVACAADPTDQ